MQINEIRKASYVSSWENTNKFKIENINWLALYYRDILVIMKMHNFSRIKIQDLKKKIVNIFKQCSFSYLFPLYFRI